MKILIHLENPPSVMGSGPFTVDEIQMMLDQNRINSSDLALMDGTFKWIAVKDIFGVKVSKTSENLRIVPDPVPTKFSVPNPKIVEEYKRVCQQCGKTWHSLVGREKQIAKNIKSNNCQVGLQACTCSPAGNAGAAQSKRNVEANQSDLIKLLSCPVCNSTNFTQEVISYDAEKLGR
jgi:hypothetical protein